MPNVLHARKELQVKIVYYGPGLGGKTTNLELVHQRTRPERRGKLISLMTESERTLFFDLLPMDLGTFRGYRVRLHLCTVPGQIAHGDTRRLVLRHVDGVVLVADSQADRLEANVEAARGLEVNLRHQGLDPDTVPLVVQYNKRDLPNALPIPVLRSCLGLREDLDEVEASARFGTGVFETLRLVTERCLRDLGDPARANEGRSPSILPGQRSSMFPGAAPPLVEAALRPPPVPTVFGPKD